MALDARHTRRVFLMGSTPPVYGQGLVQDLRSKSNLTVPLSEVQIAHGPLHSNRMGFSRCSVWADPLLYLIQALGNLTHHDVKIIVEVPQLINRFRQATVPQGKPHSDSEVPEPISSVHLAGLSFIVSWQIPYHNHYER